MNQEQPGNAADATIVTTNFATCVKALQTQDVTSRLPPGWRATYSALLSRLSRVNALSRKDLEVDPPHLDYGLFRMATSREDRVVDGMIRKASQRLAHTCGRCARPGKLRTVKFEQVVLCASCYAPKALLAEIAQVLRVLERAKESRRPAAFSEADWSERLVDTIPPDLWSQMRLPSRNGHVRFMPLDAALKIVPWLQCIHRHIESMPHVCLTE